MKVGLGLMLIALQGFAGQNARFAIIGDYGVDGPGQLAVANLIKGSLAPDFIVTVGDNNYIGGANIDRAIGKYYQAYIGNYVGTYGAGASSNRFFPALGNHDWESGSGYAAHTNYFTLPGNERYYDFVRGPVHFFVVNTHSQEPHGTSATSMQALWISNRMVSSTSPWRVVLAQDPPHSSTEAHAYMRWPFRDWGASIVVSGDSHQYERLMVEGFPFVVNGAGGAGLSGFSSPAPGSTVRYHADHGAMLVTATPTNIVYQFWSIANGGTLIDEFTQVIPTMAFHRSGANITLSWPTNGTESCVLESTAQVPGGWAAASESPVINGTNKMLTLTATNGTRYFRLRR